MSSDIRDVQVIRDEHVGYHGGYRLELHGEEIGRVERYYPTVERRSSGRRYVNARWTSKRAEYRVGRAMGAKVTFRTLRDAVHHAFASAMSARSAETEGLSPQDASATGAAGDAQTPPPSPTIGEER